MTQPTRRQFLITCAAGISVAPALWAQTSFPKFTFATISDCHLNDAASAAILEKTVRCINEDERISFAVILGDVATAAKTEELELAKKALDQFSKAWYIVPGNHDVRPKGDDPIGSYGTIYGAPRWVHAYQGWALIGFNSCDGSKSDVTVGTEELDWLRKQAAALQPDQPVALFCHHPLNPHSARYRIENADEIINIFEGHTLRIAAAGHWHGNQVETQGDILFTTTACCSTTRNNFDNTAAKGYRLFHINGDKVDTEFVEVPVDDKESES